MCGMRRCRVRTTGDRDGRLLRARRAPAPGDHGKTPVVALDEADPESRFVRACAGFARSEGETVVAQNPAALRFCGAVVASSTMTHDVGG